MKWTLQVLYSQILLIVLCLSFPSPDIQAAGTDRRSRDTYQTKTSSDKNTDKVTGKITTADGEPLAGASVIIKGTLTLTGITASRLPPKGNLILLCSNTLACAQRK